MSTQSFHGTSAFDGQSSLQSALNELLEGGLQTDINANDHTITGLKTSTLPTAAASVQYVQDYYVSSGGGGPVSLPTSLGAYQQSKPLDRTLDFTTSSTYDVLVKDSALTSGSKKTANAGMVYTEQQNRITADTALGTRIDNEITSRTNADTALSTRIDGLRLNTIAVNGTVDLAGNSIRSTALPTQSDDLVPKAYVDNAVSTTTSRSLSDIGSLYTSTAAINCSGQNLYNVGDPVSDQSAANRRYVDGLAINRVLVSTPLNDITKPTGSLDLNGQKVINSANSTTATGLVTKQQMESADGVVATNATNQIATAVNAITIDTLLQTKADNQSGTTPPVLSVKGLQVQGSFPQQFVSTSMDATSTVLTTRGYADSIYTQTKLDTSAAVDLLDSKMIKNDGGLGLDCGGDICMKSLSGNQHIIYNLQDAALETTSSQPVTGKQLLSEQTARTNADVALGLRIDNLTLTGSSIQNSTSKTKINCSTDNRIDITANNVVVGSISQATGQSTTPFLLQSTDKIQMQSALSSFGLIGSKALASTPSSNSHGVYVQHSADDWTKNNQALVSICPGASQSQALTLSSGHVDIGGGIMTNYSTVSNAPGQAQQNLQLSGGTPQTDPTINLFSSSYATAIGTTLPIQTTSKAGYSTTTAITHANQFVSKAYVDSLIVNPTTISYTNTYTGLVNGGSITVNHGLDVAFTGLTMKLYIQLLSAADGWLTTEWIQSSDIDNNQVTCRGWQSVAMGTSITQFLIVLSNGGINLLNKSSANVNGYNWSQVRAMVVVTPNDGATKIIQSQNTSATSILTVDSDIDLKSQYRIRGSLTPTLSTDLATKQYVDDNSIYATKTSAVTMSTYRITGLGYASISTDAVSVAYLTNTAWLKTFSIGAISSSKANDATLVMNGYSITGCADPVNDQDVATKKHVRDTITSSLNSYTPALVQSPAGDTVIACITGRTIQTGGLTMNATNSDVQVYSGSNTTVGTVQQLYKIVDTVGTVTAIPRYALSVIQGVANGGRGLYSMGAVQIAPATIAGQSTLSTMLFVDGTIQCYGVISLTPSERAIKSYIGPPTRSFDSVQWREYEYDQAVAVERGISLPLGRRHGYIVDEVPDYCVIDSNGTQTVNTSRLMNDLTGWLLMERHRLSSKVQSLTNTVTDLVSRLTVLESRIQ